MRILFYRSMGYKFYLFPRKLFVFFPHLHMKFLADLLSDFGCLVFINAFLNTDFSVAVAQTCIRNNSAILAVGDHIFCLDAWE